MSDIKISVYSKDLRQLVNSSFPAGLPALEQRDSPDGTLVRRLSEFNGQDRNSEVERVHFKGDRDPEDGILLVPSASYFMLAARTRPIALGPLLDVADETFGDDERRQVETAVLDELDRYDWLITPESVLALLRNLDEEDRPVLDWLDEIWAEFLRIQCEEEVRARRAELRVDAMRFGSRGRFSDVAVSIAELCLDFLYLSRICMLDAVCAPSRTSKDLTIPAALSVLDQEQDLLFEKHLVWAIHPDEVRKQIPSAELARLEAFQRARAERGLVTPHLLQENWSVEPRRGGVPPITTSRRKVATKVIRPDTETSDSGSSEPEEGDLGDPRELHRSLLHELRSRIVGEESLVGELALVAMEHLHLGDGQCAPRVLIAGRSGSGKTNASRSLIEAMKAVVGKQVGSTELHLSDMTATGWSGMDITTVAERARDLPRVKILCIQELDKAAGGNGTHGTDGLSGNSKAALLNLQSSLLGILEGSPVRTQDGTEHPTNDLLIVSTGAFGDQFTRAPTDRDLIEWGFTSEMASRFDRRLFCHGPAGPADLFNLLKHSTDSGLQSIRLAGLYGYAVEFSEPALWYLARRIFDTGENYRSSMARLENTVRKKLLACLDSEAEEGAELVISPDDIRV